ncbi:MAG: hypothetical protein J6D26_01530 [Clostridia bacterium]|nr:hypothetical protein [Clostridia bacterium]
MKKLFITLICIICLMPCCVSASQDADEFAPLYEHIMQTRLQPAENTVTVQEANSIIKKLFGEKPFKGDKVLNCQLIGYLASKCQGEGSISPGYKDIGLVSKDYRNAYAVLSSAGKLYSDEGYVYPNSELTYGMLTGALSCFEDDILSHCGIEVVSGEVSQIYMESGRTYIDVFSGNAKTKVSSKDISCVTVYKDGNLAPYSRNISRGDSMSFYTDAGGELIYIKANQSQISISKSFTDKYTLYKAKLYYLDGDMLITNNAYVYTDKGYSPSGDRYNEFVITDNTYIKENFNIIDKDVINRWLLDQNSYIICNKEGEVLYINVCK